MLHPRARTMLLLSLPALILGVASSLVLIVVMKFAAILQSVLWQRLPGSLGIAADSPLWIMLTLTFTGVLVGLVIRYSTGHAGPDPATEPLIGAPISPAALPGLIIALVLGLAGGVSLHARQALGVLGQLVAAGGQQLGRDNLAAQGRAKKHQGRLWVRQIAAHLVPGTLVHRRSFKALVAVIDQRLRDRRRQIVAVAFLGSAQCVIEVRTLLWPAGDRKQIIEVICPCG